MLRSTPCLDVKRINMYKQLPESITINEKNYHLHSHQVEEKDCIIPGWWQYWYSETESTCPPEVLYDDGCSVYYNFLVACEETEEDAINDLLNRLNHMRNE